MIKLQIIVSNKVATYVKRGGNIVCGNSDYEIEFTFDQEWDAYESKTARFIWGGKYHDVDFEGTTCPVPVVQGATLLSVGVYAGNLCTTTPALIGCEKSILCGDEPQSEGSAEQYTNEAKAAADRAEAAAEAAAEEAVQHFAEMSAEQQLGGIVQTRGNSETQVMSQKATTDALGKIESGEAMDNGFLKPRHFSTDLNVYDFPSTTVLEGKGLSMNADNSLKHRPDPLLKTIIIDMEDVEGCTITSASDYTRTITAFYYLAVLTNAEQKALTALYGSSYTDGPLSFDIAAIKARYASARYICVCMEYTQEVALNVNGYSFGKTDLTGIETELEGVETKLGDLETTVEGVREELDEVKASAGASGRSCELQLPTKSVAVVGHEWNLYHKNIIRCNNPGGCYVSYSVSPAMTTTKFYSDCLRYTPVEADIGAHTVTVFLRDRATDEELGRKQFTLHVIADTALTDKRVLFIGDSLTDAGIYPAEIQHNLSNGGLISLGTRSDTVTIGGASLAVNHEGRSGWASYDYTRTGSSYRTDAENPFWDGSAFNFAWYMEQQGYDGVDIVCINLGTNGVSNAATVPAIDAMIESIHAYDPNILVLVSLITNGASQDGWGVRVNALSPAAKFDIDAFNLRAQYLEKYAGRANVDVTDLYLALDCDHDFDTVTQVLSARNPNTTVKQANNVHPSEYGYLKYADVYYNNILYHLTN